MVTYPRPLSRATVAHGLQPMPPVRIVDCGDPRLAEYRAVSEPDLARNLGIFIAEGRFVVRRLIEHGRCRIRSVLLNEAALLAMQPSLDDLPSSTPVYVTADFRAITGFDIHRGCLAAAERPPEVAWPRLAFSARTLVLLEGVSNADNIGGVFRNAAAFGVNAVLLGPGCGDPLYRKAVRTSMGAVLGVPFARLADWPAGLADVRREGFSLVALTPREPSVTVDAFVSTARPARLALLIGAEGTGLSEGALAFADARVRIPTTSAVDSLNLVVAAGIALARLSSVGADATCVTPTILPRV